MKKLMTMISAVAVAFGLQAAAPYPSGSHFNEENWLETASETKMWTSLEGLSISTESATFQDQVGLPAQFADEVMGNNLAFKRGLTDPTYRAIALKDDGAPAKQTIGAKGVVVDTLIKFTPYDGDDQANIEDTNAKVAVWVKEIEGADGAASTYQLMVTAGQYVNENLVRKDYACSSKITDMDAWYRLTVKAIPDVTNGGRIPGFIVLINGETVTSGEVKKDLTNVPLSTDGTKWNATGAIFPALISDDQTLQQVGFAGQGWIDDLSITDQIPDFVETTPVFTITGGDHVESFRYNGQTWKKGDVALIVPTTSAASEVTDIVYEDGYFGDSTATVTKTENYENKVGNAQALVATVTIGDVATSYATINDAITAINKATSDVTLKLGADCSDYLSFENKNDVTVTIDLAGKTASDDIYTTCRLVIIDSVGTGTVDGKVDVDGGSVEIQGGKYLASKNGTLASTATLPEGRTLVSDGNGYLVLGEQGAEDGTEANPYTISTVEDLQKVVQYGIGTAGAGKHFVLKNDLVLAEAFDSIGARDNKPQKDKSFSSEIAFTGIFDGGGHTISGVVLKCGDYVGFFGSAYGATIKNLKIALGNTTGFDLGNNYKAQYCGGVIVGVAVATTIENCETVKSEVSTAFVTEKAAGGIVGFAGSGSVLKGCVNNLNLKSTKDNKAAGLVGCAQDVGGVETKGLVIDGCTNNGDVEGGSHVAGLVSYTDCAVTFKGVNTVNGKLTWNGGVPLSVISLNTGSVTLDGASFVIPADYPTVNKAVDGLNFAKVEADGKVTLVADSEAVANASLKVMANGAPVVGLKKGESITLDETLATANITVPEGCEPKKNGNTYTMVEKSEVKPVTPGTSSKYVYDSEDAAKAAADAINAKPEDYITAPEGVVLENAAAYAQLFQATVNGSTVTVDLTVAATKQIQDTVDAGIKAIKVAEIAAADGATEQTITTVPGLYYSVIAGDTLMGMAVKSCTPATGAEMKITLPKGEGATSGFYKIQATVQKVPVAE